MTFQRELIPIDLEKNKRDAIAKLEKQKQVKKDQEIAMKNRYNYQNYYNLSNIKKFKSHQVTENFLNTETALKEFEDMCENYQLFRIKDEILTAQKEIIAREHDTFTIRRTAKLIDLVANQIFTKHDIK